MNFFHMLFQVEHRSEHFTAMFTWTGFLHMNHFDMGIQSTQSWKNLSTFVTNMCSFNLFCCTFFFVNKLFIQCVKAFSTKTTTESCMVCSSHVINHILTRIKSFRAPWTLVVM